MKINYENVKDKLWRMQNLYHIRTKDKKIALLNFNPIQQEYWRKRSDKDLIVKARQHGITTLKALDYFDETIFNFNTTSAIIAHKQFAVQKIFRIVKLAYELMDDELKPVAKYDNVNELVFPEINSNIYVATEIRGDTVHNLHISEMAFIKNLEAKMTATLEAVPAGGHISGETTTNGVGGYFYDTYQEALRKENEWTPHFYGWNLNPEYQIDVTEPLELTEAEKEIKKTYNLTDNQLLWRRMKIKRLKRNFAQEYPINAYEAFISSGRNRFDVDLLRDLEKQAKKPLSDADGLVIWVNPVEGRKYVAGSDVAEGKQTSDWSVTDIYDFESCEQVAQLRVKLHPERFAMESLKLVKKYNDAFWGIEKQNHGFTVLSVVRKHYRNLFFRVVVDKKKENKKTEDLGWSTDAKSKPVMIDDLDTMVIDENIKINSPITLNEMMTYVEDEKGITNGQEGCNDDTVISTAIAMQMRKHYKEPKKFDFII